MVARCRNHRAFVSEHCPTAPRVFRPPLEWLDRPGHTASLLHECALSKTVPQAIVPVGALCVARSTGLGALAAQDGALKARTTGQERERRTDSLVRNRNAGKDRREGGVRSANARHGARSTEHGVARSARPKSASPGHEAQAKAARHEAGTTRPGHEPRNTRRETQAQGTKRERRQRAECAVRKRGDTK